MRRSFRQRCWRKRKGKKSRCSRLKPRSRWSGSRPRTSSRNRWSKRQKRKNRPTNSTWKKNNRSKRLCKLWSIAKWDRCRSRIKKRKKLFKICSRHFNSNSNRKSQRSSLYAKKRPSTWLMWRSLIPEKKLSKRKGQIKSKLKTKYLKSSKLKKRREGEMQKNFRTWEGNFTRKSSKLWWERRKDKSKRREKDRGWRWWELKRRQKRRKEGRKRKRKWWRLNSEDRWWKSSPERTSLNN